ncbi:unnamed protein product [Phyllotreta striolata]|uniref:Cytochrome P450 n=1 Tax=Phyllotreta striolata TaxID=444603 RepID=A0A9N9TGR4_PHYSR|nr:unnamed protein product [Phyllotreta striolata]
MEHFDLQKVLFSIFFVTLLTWCVNYLWWNRRSIICTWRIPGPPTFPIIGNSYKFFRRDVELFDILIEYFQYPGIGKFLFGNKLWCLIFEPRYIQKVLNSSITIDKPKDYDRVTELIGEGLLSSSYEISQPIRKAVAPMFSEKALMTYVPIFNQSSALFANILKQLAGQKSIHWETITAKYFVDTSCKTLLGFNVPINLNESNKYDLAYCIRRVIDLLTYRYVSIWLNVRFLWNLSKTKKEIDKCLEIFENHVQQILKKRIEKNGQDKFENDLFRYIDTNPGFSKAEVSDIDVIKPLLALSVEVSSITLCTVLITLALYPDIQQQVHQEVVDVVGQQQIKISDLPRLELTDRVIKETMRLFPPFTIYARETTAELHLDQYIIPADSTMVIFPELVHRNPKYWKDPLQFDPNRFLPEAVAQRNPYAYIPFSHGARNCLGWEHSLVNLKIVTATVIRDLKVFTDYKSIEEIKRNFKLILKLPEGCKLWFEIRK